MNTMLIRSGIAVCTVCLFFGVAVNVTIPVVARMPQGISEQQVPKPLGVHIVLHGTKGAHGWYISSVTFSVYCDNGTIPVEWFYAIDGGAWVPYTGTIVLCHDGSFGLSVMVIDQYGNQWTDSCDVKIDMSPPQMNLHKQVFLLKQLYTATAVDNTSGMWYVEFSVDNQSQVNLTMPPYTWDWTGHGNHTLTVKAVDMAGLDSTESQQLVPRFPRLYRLMVWILGLFGN